MSVKMNHADIFNTNNVIRQKFLNQGRGFDLVVLALLEFAVLCEALDPPCKWLLKERKDLDMLDRFFLPMESSVVFKCNASDTVQKVVKKITKPKKDKAPESASKKAKKTKSSSKAKAKAKPKPKAKPRAAPSGMDESVISFVELPDGTQRRTTFVDDVLHVVCHTLKDRALRAEAARKWWR